MSAADIRLLIALLILVFLFTGEPDVWDQLHALTIDALSVKATP